MSSSTGVRTVRVHQAEIGTEGDSLAGYAETLALLLCAVALLASAWAVTTPSETADLQVPAVGSTPIPALMPQPDPSFSPLDVLGG